MMIHPLLEPYKPTVADPFDAVKAAHLLNRAGFGGTPDEVERVRKLGPIDAVDWLLDFPDASATDQGQSDLPDLSSIAGYPRSYRQIFRKTRGMSKQDRKEFRMEVQFANSLAIKSTIDWWLGRMAYGPNPLQEKLTLFWHGHFTTSARDERSAMLMWNQNELLRSEAVRNFRTLLRKISRDPAMLDYLNNTQNRKGHANENFGREVMELFTLGIGNYTEVDVKQGSRAFTGWTHDGDAFIFRSRQHDYGIKHYLGRTGDFNGDDVLDTILSQQVCAPFIASKLFRYFAYEEPDDSMVQALGSKLRDDQYALRPLVRTILTSRAFYSDAAMYTQIKSPVQLLIGTVRQLDLQMPRERAMNGYLTQMGQMPFAPPNVRGWPGGRNWISTSSMFIRTNMGVYLAGGGAVNLPRVGRVGKTGKGKSITVDEEYFEPEHSDQVADNSTGAIVDGWLDRLIQRPIDPTKRQVLIEALGNSPVRTENLRKMVQLIVSMPEYQLC